MAIRTRTRGTRLLVVILISVSLATITFDYRQGEDGPLAGLGRGALALMAPLQKAVSSVTRPVGDFFTGLAEAPALRRQKEELQRQLEVARREVARYASDQADYQELLGQLALLETLGLAEGQSVQAVVTATAPSNFEWVITIDKGTSDGIQPHMPVVASTGLVGTVTSATGSASKVQLIIDQDSWVSSRLAGTTGVLQGQGASDLVMAGVNPNAHIELDETVQTSGYQIRGFGSLYPPGIPIGTVSRYSPDPTALSQVVKVRPAVDFSGLKFVTVLLIPGGG